MASASPTLGSRRSPDDLDEASYDDVKSPTPTGSLSASASPSPTPSPGSNSRVSSPRPIVTPLPTIHLLASNKVLKVLFNFYTGFKNVCLQINIYESILRQNFINVQHE